MAESPGALVGPAVEVLAHGPLSWVYLQRPGDLESDLLARHYRLRTSHLAEALSSRSTVRALEASSYVYFTLATPSRSRLSRTINVATAAVFVGIDFVICVDRGDARPLARLFRECQSDEARLSETMSSGSVALALAILSYMAGPASEMADGVKDTLDELGDGIAAGDDRGLASELSHVERDVAGLEGVLGNARAALEALIHFVGRTSLSDEAAEALGLLRERIDRSFLVLDLARREATGLARAGELLASQRTASAARLAAGLLAALLPPIAVAVFFGMNLRDLPLVDLPYAFEVLLGLSIVLALFAIWQLRRHRWV